MKKEPQPQLRKKIDIKTNVTVPACINVPLERSDIHYLSNHNIFRFVAEIGIAFTAGTFTLLFFNEVPSIKWIIFLFCLIVTVIFGGCSCNYYRKYKKCIMGEPTRPANNQNAGNNKSTTGDEVVECQKN